MGLSVIILAGGTGSRMGSKIPKVLHKLAGKPLLGHVIDSVQNLNPDEIYVVYGHMGEFVKSSMADKDVLWVEQKERLGTGHAVLQVLPYLKPNNQALILYGDVPLITTETLSHFVEGTGYDQLGLLTAIVQNPKGLGRILRDEYRQVMGIVEEKDATDVQKQICEINTGIYCAPVNHLNKWLPNLKNNNAQKEYYLTDIVGFAKSDHVGISVSKPKAVEETYGTNTRVELARLERVYQAWQVERLMLSGCTIMDPHRVDVRGNIKIGQDSTVDINVVFEGDVEIGEECYIGPNCVIKDSFIEEGVYIEANSHIEGARVYKNSIIGPFARLRPGSVLSENSKIGNFVELKNAVIGKGSKVNHLSYIGDTQMGESVNIGAGVITCNYDGVNKHQTIIEDNVFVGSDCQLIAPVKLEKNSTIGAGSTITKTAKAGALSLSRSQQKTIEGYQRPKKSSK